MKSLLSDIDIARDFLKTFLPEPLQVLLDFKPEGNKPHCHPGITGSICRRTISSSRGRQ
ncbi:MAG: hypothetical protein IPH16_07020 [Haliscomenobacter sp.]|nr:hypothetical protein [Haliscomenobacter sp.]